MLPAASHVNIIGTSAPPSTEFYAHSVYWLCHRNQREEPWRSAQAAPIALIYEIIYINIVSKTPLPNAAGHSSIA